MSKVPAGTSAQSANATDAQGNESLKGVATETSGGTAGTVPEGGQISSPTNTAGMSAQAAGGKAVGKTGSADGAGGNTADPSAKQAASAADSPCAGHGDENFCDGAVLHHCGASVEASTADTCMSEAMCQVGTASGVCGACIPGTFRCEGPMLNQCTDDGQYMLAMQCESEVLCKEDAGACLDMQCVPESVTCSSDGTTLKTCNTDGSAFAEERLCGKAGCNQTLKTCNACMPGAKSCSGNALMTCSSDGQDMLTTECMPTGGECSTAPCRNNACVPGVKPVSSGCSGGKCDAMGRCVACVTATDCPDPGPCNNRTCSSGTCAPQPKAAGSACQGTGWSCDGRGACMQKPCGNGVLDASEVCEVSLYERGTCNSSSCRLEDAAYRSCTVGSAMAAGTCPVNGSQGWFCGYSGVCSHACSTPDQCRTTNGKGDCLPAPGGMFCAISCSTGADCATGVCLDFTAAGGRRVCGSMQPSP